MSSGLLRRLDQLVVLIEQLVDELTDVDTARAGALAGGSASTLWPVLGNRVTQTLSNERQDQGVE